MRVRRLLLIAAGASLAAALVFRFWAQSELWFDEALSVKVAALPLDRIPEALRHDGHPPLFYFMLHVWMDVFGDGDVAVRALSGVLSVATLPLAWFAGRRIGGRAGAWTALLVFATSPYAFRYATETRMYAFMMLCVTGGYLVLRNALERSTLPRLVLIAVITAALELSQYWNLYLVAVVGLALVVRWRRAPDSTERRASFRAAVAMAVGSLAFVPWLPSFIEQIKHTGTPWGGPQFPWVVVPRTLVAFSGNEKDGEAYVLLFLLLVLALLAVFGRGVDASRIEVDLRTRPGVRLEAATAIGVLIVGSVISYVTDTAFMPRYAAVIFPLFALVVVFGFRVFVSDTMRIGVLAAVVALGLVGGVRNARFQRTQASQSADVIVAEARAGDVVAYCSDLIAPDVSRLLRHEPGIDEVAFPGHWAPGRVNWTDYPERLAAADPRAFVRAAVNRAGDHTVWFVWGQPGHAPNKCNEIQQALDDARTPQLRVAPSEDIDEARALTEYRAP